VSTVSTRSWTRYTSTDEDSARWERFDFRDGDIVISSRSKSGTTWVQMICALLVFRTPELPAPLPVLSPWLDHLVEPIEEVAARLEAQEHRRFVKTHTPLDGVPLDERATYVVVARDPLDAAVSLYHQAENIDRERLHELTGAPAGSSDARAPLHSWLADWVVAESDPAERMDSLSGFLHHLSDAWRRRREPNVVLVHYADLARDLPGEMRRIASRLGIDVPPATWPLIVEAATFRSMRARAASLTPDTLGIFKDRSAFFRRGRSGAGREVLSADELRGYEQRVTAALGAELSAWLLR